VICHHLGPIMPYFAVIYRHHADILRHFLTRTSPRARSEPPRVQPRGIQVLRSLGDPLAEHSAVLPDSAAGCTVEAE